MHIAVFFSPILPHVHPLVLFRQRSVIPTDKQFCITFVYTAVARAFFPVAATCQLICYRCRTTASFVHCILIPAVCPSTRDCNEIWPAASERICVTLRFIFNLSDIALRFLSLREWEWLLLLCITVITICIWLLGVSFQIGCRMGYFTSPSTKWFMKWSKIEIIFHH